MVEMEVEMEKNIVLSHAGGFSEFSSSEILSYKTIENLIASEILQGVPNREKSLTQLWEAAQSLAAQSGEAEDVSQTEERLQEEETLQTY